MKREEVIKIMKIAILTTFLALLSCDKTQENTTIYTINKGNHHSVRRVELHKSSSLIFNAKFDNSAIYKTVKQENQRDINKLCGFSECNQNHQENSARFGWRWLGGKLEIHAYVYNSGIRRSKFIRNVELNKLHDYEIVMHDGYYIFRVEEVEARMNRTNKCNIGVYYRLLPYFGGDEKAPHDIIILIIEKRKR